MLQAVRLGFRALVRQPRLMFLLVLTLALGIGANAAVFTVLDAVLLQPLPYADPERLVRIFESSDLSPRMGLSNPNFLDWREQSTSFDAIAVYAGGPDTVLGGREPAVADVYVVSDAFFEALGVRPQRGRTFERQEHRVGATPAVVVTDRFWRETLGAEPDLGRLTVRVGAFACRVVGVMPKGFAFPAEADLYVPKELDADTSGRTAHNLRAIGRLRSGVTKESALAELNTIAARIERQHGSDNDAQRAALVDLREQLTSRVRSGLLLLQGVVLLVLLAACANVAGGLLTRGAERRKELAVRAALGAARGTLVRHLLAEGLALAVAGGVAGSLLAWWGVRTLRVMGPAWLPRLEEVTLDWRVVAFVTGVSIVAALVFGMLPALQGARLDLREALTAEGRCSSSSLRGRTRHALVAVEVALALTLLLGSGLLLRSLINVVTSDAGFDATGALALSVTLPGARYEDDASGARYFDRALASIAALPGVAAVGVTSALPLDGPSASGGFQIESRPELSKADWQQGPTAGYRLGSSGYFRALAVPMIHGRPFGDADDAGATPVAVVNQALVDRYFAGRDPLGQRIRFLGMDRENPWLTIVGVVGNVRHDGLDTGASPEVFAHYRQLPSRTRYGMVMVARAASGDANALAPAARRTLRDLDPDVPLAARTMSDIASESVGDRRLTLALVILFTLVVLTLSMAGVYGVVGHTVSARTREMGIRMALGADSRDVVLLILRSSLVGLGAGIAGGVAGGLLAGRTLQAFLVGVTPTDPGACVAGVGLLLVTGLVAALLPARRATRIDPLTALR